MQAVGRILLGMLDDLVASSSWWYHGSAGHAERLQGTLLLLDRTEEGSVAYINSTAKATATGPLRLTDTIPDEAIHAGRK